MITDYQRLIGVKCSRCKAPPGRPCDTSDVPGTVDGVDRYVDTPSVHAARAYLATEGRPMPKYESQADPWDDSGRYGRRR